MKKTMLMLCALCAAACAKETRIPSAQDFVAEEGREICFDIAYEDAFTVTKLTEINRDNLSEFNLLATTGSEGSESEQWSATASKHFSTGQYVSGKYWPATNPSYHFYASNAAITFAAAGSTVSVDSSSDVVCACIYTPTFNTTNDITFSHILARIGTVEITSANSYDVTINSINLMETKTSGTYNLRTKDWTNQSGAASAALAEGTNDYLLLPGSYSLQVNYTLVKGDYSGTFTSSGTVALNPGKTSNIKVTLSADPAVPVNFSVSVEAWEAKSVRLTLD